SFCGLREIEKRIDTNFPPGLREIEKRIDTNFPPSSVLRYSGLLACGGTSKVQNYLRVLTGFLNKLDQFKIRYTLSADVRTSIMVCVALPGERWEVNFYDDGDIAVEIFKSDGYIFDESKLTEFFE